MSVGKWADQVGFDDVSARLNAADLIYDSQSLEGGENVWAAPSASDPGSVGLSGLRKRIRPSGDAVGWDGDPCDQVITRRGVGRRKT